MKRTPNVALKMAMFATGKHQRRIAVLARIPADKLSHAIYGRRDLDKEERARLAKILGKSVDELFTPESEERAS